MAACGRGAPGSDHVAGGGNMVSPEPALFERFTVTYPSGTVIESYYPGGATLREVEVTHPMATVEVAEDIT